MNNADMVSISMELTVQIPDKSTFYHPRKINLSRLFLNKQKLQRLRIFHVSSTQEFTSNLF